MGYVSQLDEDNILKSTYKRGQSPLLQYSKCEAGIWVGVIILWTYFPFGCQD